ncbi:helix-turn-helix transcriptional regulator [Halorarum halobium]|uniref:helix-turn-helix transcriptional regulator n=1 Tax=Halorarum halobium TaxID=3075121 RepID=UPI0028A59E07|nr:hypothetical protein [Halobaculum sp. XH14]
MRHVALLLAVLCLLAPVPAAATLPADAGPGAASDPGRVTAPSQFGDTATPFDDSTTTFNISLRENGNARWTVGVEYRLEDPESREAFEAYADGYRDDGSETGPSTDVFRNAAVVAAEHTGREMRIRNVNYTAGLRNETTGVLRLRFTWTNFLERTENGTLVLGDVFVTGPEETWFRTLQSGQRLVIQPPPGYTAPDISIEANYRLVSRNIVVTEPYTFAAGDISVTFTGSEEEAPFWQDTQFLIGSALLLGVLVVGAYLLSRRRPGTAGTADERTTAGDPPAGSVDGDGVAAVGGDATNGGTEDAVAAEGGGAAASNPEPDPELLSDEERVERLLDRNGGRMRQADIVSETGWSDAKVSQLLSTMADDGDVEKLRLGRENLISLPDGDEDEGPRGNGV